MMELVSSLDTPGAVVATCFSSNFARLETLAFAARQNGRKVSVLKHIHQHVRRLIVCSRACWAAQSPQTSKSPQTVGICATCKVVSCVVRSGWLTASAGHNGFVSVEEVLAAPPNQRFFVSTGMTSSHMDVTIRSSPTTGCQGEPMSALQRISEGTHPLVSLSAGDVVIFSSRTIPGNESLVARVHNNLLQRGLPTANELCNLCLTAPQGCAWWSTTKRRTRM